MGKLSSLYPDAEAVEEALNRANQAEIDIISIKQRLDDLEYKDISFLRLNNVPLSVWTTCCLSVRSLMAAWVASVFCCCEQCFYEHRFTKNCCFLLSLPLGMCPAGGQLDRVICLSLTF